MTTATKTEYTISVTIDGTQYKYGHGCGDQWEQADCDFPEVPRELPDDIYEAAKDGVSDVFESDGITWTIHQD